MRHWNTFIIILEFSLNSTKFALARDLIFKYLTLSLRPLILHLGFSLIKNIRKNYKITSLQCNYKSVHSYVIEVL